MKELSKILQILKKSKFVNCSIKDHAISPLKILKHGRLVVKNLLHEWIIKKEAVGSTIFVKSENKTVFDDTQLFATSNQLYSKLIKANEVKVLNYPLIIKQQIKCINPDFAEPQTKLISDFLFDRFCGLEKFYNIQSQRKIWWMTQFSNPSCFTMHSCDKNGRDGMPVVKIKSLFPFQKQDFESISFINLKDINFLNYPVLLFGHPFKDLSVIRSIIDLEASIFALLLDACSNVDNETTYLYHKLAPYQCAVTGCYDGKNTKQLEELNVHISHVIESSGIRIYPKKFSKNNIRANELPSELNAFDQLGIPYVIILEDMSLENGFLKLRNRDTFLNETIHISDLPSYMKLLLK